MGWLNFLRGKSVHGARRPRPPQPRPGVRLGVEHLETREMLSVSASLGAGVLTVTGGPTNNHIDLSLAGSQLIVRDAGRVVGSFANASVNSISITGGPGNDNIKIALNVTQPATIDGGAGNDVLQAGGGNTILIAGTGNDKLVGGPGANVFMGGSGNDIFVSTSGRDMLNAGPGRNKLFITGGDILSGVGPQDTVIGGIDMGDPAADPPSVLTAAEVGTLLQRAAAASASNDAIIAVVDRGGRILGVRVEGQVAPDITGSTNNLVFAIDGAVAEARTAAFFANNQAPLTSRTIEFISQSTITQREVEADPSSTDPFIQGPGFVAPVGVGGHFPPNVSFTPQVDLFAIEHTNRDRTVDLSAGLGRFNVVYNAGQGIPLPDSYGFVSGLEPNARPRGIGTLPGGIPIYHNGVLVGGIGVFFPGKTGYADEENSSLSTTYNPAKPDRSLEAEYIAFAAAGGSSGFQVPIGTINGVPALAGFDLPAGRIDLVGITLDIYGPGGRMGAANLVKFGQTLGVGDPNSGSNKRLNAAGTLFLDQGLPLPSGWLVGPHASTTDPISAADVNRIILQGVAQANQTRAAIRLPLSSTTKMVFAVTDSTGQVLGLFRMPDATYFSVDVAVAKARNVAYYDSSAQLQPIDQLPGVPAGVAFTNRTFRYLAEPRFPEGIDGMPPAPFSVLNDGGADPNTGLQVGPRLPASAYHSVLGYDSFNPGTDFRRPADADKINRRNGIVFFPGSTALYKNGRLIGGLGVSGDGVDQDDVVTFFASAGFAAPTTVVRADQIIFNGIRLPYQKFNRSPLASG